MSTHQATLGHLQGDPAERSNLRNADVTRSGVSGTSLSTLGMLLAALSAVPQTGTEAGRGRLKHKAHPSALGAFITGINYLPIC